MALPILPNNNMSGNRESQTESILRDQRNSIVKLTGAFMGTERVLRYINKDIQNMRKEIASNANNFSELKKYFEQQKTPLEQKKIEVKDDKKENTVTRALSKLLGKEENSKDTEQKFASMYGPESGLIKEIIELKNIAARTDNSMSMLVKYFTGKDQKKKDSGKEESDSGGGIFGALGAAVLGLGTMIGKVIGSFGSLLGVVGKLSGIVLRILPAFASLGRLLAPVLGVLARFAPLAAVVAGGAYVGSKIGDAVSLGIAKMAGWEDVVKKIEGGDALKGRQEEEQQKNKFSPDAMDRSKEMEEKAIRAQFEALPMIGQEKRRQDILQSGDTLKMMEEVEAYREQLSKNSDAASKKELERLDAVQKKAMDTFHGIDTSVQKTVGIFNTLRQGLLGEIPGAENLSEESMMKMLNDAFTIDLGKKGKIELLNIGDLMTQSVNDLTQSLQEGKQPSAPVNISQNNVTQNTVGGGSSTQFLSSRPDTGNSGMAAFRNAIPIF